MSDIMSGKVENGLKILKMGAACLVFPFGNLLEWAIALHGRVLVPFLQMNSTYHNSTLLLLMNNS